MKRPIMGSNRLRREVVVPYMNLQMQYKLRLTTSMRAFLVCLSLSEDMYRNNFGPCE